MLTKITTTFVDAIGSVGAAIAVVLAFAAFILWGFMLCVAASKADDDAGL